MKKVILGVMALMVAFVLAAPAMAEVRLTTTGYMDVKGILVKENIVNGATFEADSTNAFYKQKMVIDPVLHINDKVRVHGRVTIMENFFEGSAGAHGLSDPVSKTDDRVNYRATNNNFWFERLYLSFPLFSGHLYVGRQSGGSWGTWFQDWDANRDRIKWVGKIPGTKIVLAGLLETLRENDGGPNIWVPDYQVLTTNPDPNGPWTQSSSDLRAYALGAVIPIGSSFVWKPLSYNIQFQDRAGWDYVFMNEIGWTIGGFSLSAELNYRKRDWDGFGGLPQWDEGQFSGWAEGNFGMGPFSFGVGLFYLEGNDSMTVKDSKSIWSVGAEFQPYFLFFSEDVGLLWDTAGVPNGTAGASGYESLYVKASFKLSETMKLTGLVGYLQASEMNLAGVDDEIGMEFDLNFEWKFMDNLKYVADLGYLKAGDYWKNVTEQASGKDLSNDPYGMRHMLVIQW